MLVIRLLCLLIVLFCSAVMAEPSTTVFKFCYEDREVFPYYTGQGSAIPLKRPGASIELLQKLDEETPEIRISFQRSPWKRCLYNLELGVIDAVIASYKKDRERIAHYPKVKDKLDFSRAVNESSSYCLYVRDGVAHSWDGIRFTGKWDLPIAVPVGYSIADFIRGQKMNVYEVKDNNKALMLVQSKRVSAAALLCEPATKILDQESTRYPDVHLHHPPLEIRGAYLMISKPFYQQYPELSETLWDRLTQLRNEYYELLYFSYMSQ